MRLIPVARENLQLAWSDVQGYIQEALKYSDDTYNITDVLDLLIKGECLLCVIYNDEKQASCGAVVCEIIEHPRHKAFFVFLLGAKSIDDIIEELLESLEKYAHIYGCRTIEFCGRLAWEKKTKKLGFEKIHTVMRKKLSEA